MAVSASSCMLFLTDSRSRNMLLDTAKPTDMLLKVCVSGGQLITVADLLRAAISPGVLLSDIGQLLNCSSDNFKCLRFREICASGHVIFDAGINDIKNEVVSILRGADESEKLTLAEKAVEGVLTCLQSVLDHSGSRISVIVPGEIGRDYRPDDPKGPKTVPYNEVTLTNYARLVWRKKLCDLQKKHPDRISVIDNDIPALKDNMNKDGLHYVFRGELALMSLYNRNFEEVIASVVPALKAVEDEFNVFLHVRKVEDFIKRVKVREKLMPKRQSDVVISASSLSSGAVVSKGRNNACSIKLLSDHVSENEANESSASTCSFSIRSSSAASSSISSAFPSSMSSSFADLSETMSDVSPVEPAKTPLLAQDQNQQTFDGSAPNVSPSTETVFATPIIPYARVSSQHGSLPAPISSSVASQVLSDQVPANEAKESSASPCSFSFRISSASSSTTSAFLSSKSSSVGDFTDIMSDAEAAKTPLMLQESENQQTLSSIANEPPSTKITAIPTVPSQHGSLPAPNSSSTASQELQSEAIPRGLNALAELPIVQSNPDKVQTKTPLLAQGQNQQTFGNSVAHVSSSRKSVADVLCARDSSQHGLQVLSDQVPANEAKESSASPCSFSFRISSASSSTTSAFLSSKSSSVGDFTDIMSDAEAAKTPLMLQESENQQTLSSIANEPPSTKITAIPTVPSQHGSLPAPNSSSTASQELQSEAIPRGLNALAELPIVQSNPDKVQTKTPLLAQGQNQQTFGNSVAHVSSSRKSVADVLCARDSSQHGLQVRRSETNANKQNAIPIVQTNYRPSYSAVVSSAKPNSIAVAEGHSQSKSGSSATDRTANGALRIDTIPNCFSDIQFNGDSFVNVTIAPRRRGFYDFDSGTDLESQHEYARRFAQHVRPMPSDGHCMLHAMLDVLYAYCPGHCSYSPGVQNHHDYSCRRPTPEDLYFEVVQALKRKPFLVRLFLIASANEDDDFWNMEENQSLPREARNVPDLETVSPADKLQFAINCVSYFFYGRHYKLPCVDFIINIIGSLFRRPITMIKFGIGANDPTVQCLRMWPIEDLNLGSRRRIIEEPVSARNRKLVCHNVHYSTWDCDAPDRICHEYVNALEKREREQAEERLLKQTAGSSRDQVSRESSSSNTMKHSRASAQNDCVPGTNMPRSTAAGASSVPQKNALSASNRSKNVPSFAYPADSPSDIQFGSLTNVAAPAATSASVSATHTSAGFVNLNVWPDGVTLAAIDPRTPSKRPVAGANNSQANFNLQSAPEADSNVRSQTSPPIAKSVVAAQLLGHNITLVAEGVKLPSAVNNFGTLCFTKAAARDQYSNVVPSRGEYLQRKYGRSWESMKDKSSRLFKKDDGQWVREHVYYRYLRFLLYEDSGRRRFVPGDSNQVLADESSRRFIARALSGELYESGFNWAVYFLEKCLGVSVEEFMQHEGSD